MTARLETRLDLAPALARPTATVLVGLSGGLDSTVLLHALARTALRPRLRAVHVDHGLHACAADWASHCGRVCTALDVPLTVVGVKVRSDGAGPEAAARRARHRAFAGIAAPGDIVALAHHRDDQAETFLLRALRASGPDGLAAMRAWRALGDAFLWRPLLDRPRAELLAFARELGLDWIEDPSNADDGIDRNFLRTRVMPLLHSRWPQAGAAFAASAGLACDAAALLEAEDRSALDACRAGDDTLSISALLDLAPARRARVVRSWVAHCGLPPLPARGITRLESEVLPARGDAQARFDWGGASLRAWDGRLHAVASATPLPLDFDVAWDGYSPLDLPQGARLQLVPGCPLPPGVRVRARRGGERIRLPGRGHRHALKHVLQSLHVPPWTRAQLPLIVLDDEVLAAGDVILSGPLAAALDAAGARIEWMRPHASRATHPDATSAAPDSI